MGQGGTFGGDGFELVPVFLEVFVAFGSEGFPDHGVFDGGDADFLFEEEWVESGLSAHADRSGDAGGLASDGIFAARIGHVVMVSQPETGGGTGRTSLAKYAGWVDVPLFGFVAKELNGSGSIMHGSWEEFDSSQAVFNGSHTVTLVQHGIRDGVLVFPSEPTSPMNEDKEGCWFIGFDFPEIDMLFLVVSVLHVFERRFNIGSLQGVEEDGEKSQ